MSSRRRPARQDDGAPDLISTPEQLQGLVKRLESASEVAFDTEFHGERSYWPKLMLVQISTADEVTLIDPRAPQMANAVTEFFGSLCGPDRVIVGHDVRADLEIFYRLAGRLPGQVFDTQIAAAFLGMGQRIGLGNLVERLLEVDLPKGHTLADWSRRPLPAEQIRYAASDVRYLPRLTEILRHGIQERNRTAWVQEECARLLDLIARSPDRPARSLKGVKRLPPVGTRAALLVDRLADAREELARKLDRRPRHVLPDDVLVDLAKRAPTKRSDLVGTTSRRRPPGLKRHGDLWIRTIREGMNSPLPPRRQDAPRLRAGQQDFMGLVRLFVNWRVHRMELASGLVMKQVQDGIHRVVTGSPQDRETFDELLGLYGWRRESFSDDLWSLYRGEMHPVVRQGPEGPCVHWEKTPRS